MLKRFILFLYCLLIFVNFTTALKCFVCSQSGASDDQTCLNNPNGLGENGKITCNKKYCTTFRQDLKDPPVLATFSRGCEDAPVFINKDVIDETYKTYYRACTKSLCNNGTGNEPITGNGFGNDIGKPGVIYIPGIKKNSASSLFVINNILLISLIATYCFFIIN